MATNGKDVIEGEVVHESALAVVKPDASLVLAPVMDIALAKKRLAEFQEFVAGYLKEGEDFGTIPGTPKPTLYKPGADKLCELYGLADTYRFAIPPIEDFKAEPSLFDYTIECSLWRGDRLVATGMGSCNSYESKYKLRDQQRVCPICHKAAIIKGKNFETGDMIGGGWVCWKKRDGCGAKFQDGAKEIENQPAGKIINDDIATLKNTVLKMAKKRAKIDATLSATRSSGVFTQDMEDIGAQDDTNGAGTKAAANAVAERKKAEHAAKTLSITGHETDPAKVATWTGKKSSVSKVSVLMGEKDGKVYGQGLASLLALLDKHKPAWRADVRWDESEMCQKVAARAALAMQQFCEAHGMECEFVEKATGEVREHKRAILADGKLAGPLDAADLRKLKQKVGSVLAMRIGEYEVSLFDNAELSLDGKRVRAFDELQRSLHQLVEFAVKSNGQYLNVTRILRIGCFEWDEEGVPVIRRDAPAIYPGITDADLGI